MFTDDVKFYTVKQIDDYLQTDEIILRCKLLEKWGFTPSCEQGGHPWFALEHARNELIDRLKTRLAIANGMGYTINGEKRAKVLMDTGFSKYEAMFKFGAVDVCANRHPVRPSEKIEKSFISYAGFLLDNIKGLKEAKFVFCDESIEFMFHTEDNLDYSFEFFYDTAEEMIARVGIQSKSTWSDGQKNRDYLAGSIKCFDLDAALQIVEETQRLYQIGQEH